MSKSFLMLLIMLIFLDKEINLYREELTLGLVIMLFYWFHRHRTDYFYQAIVFFVILVPIHPIAAMVHALFYIFFNLSSKEEIMKHIDYRRLITYVNVGILLYLYANHTSFGIATFALGAKRVSIGHIPELLFFFKMSLPLVLALLVYTSKVKENRIMISVSLTVFSILFFVTGGHYYYIYLIFFLILCLSRSNERIYFAKIERIGLQVLMLSSVYFTIGHRILVYSESAGYSNHIHTIFNEVENIDFTHIKGNIYISNHFVMPIIQNENVRMTLEAVPHVLNGQTQVFIGDEIYLVSRDELTQFKNSRYNTRCEVSEIVKPHKGILSISYFYKKRVNQFGLWRCKVIQ